LKALVFVVLALAPASILLAEEKPKWQAEWGKTVELAKKEGQVTVYLDYTAGPVLDTGVFQKSFPGIKVVGVPNRNSEVRLSTERRAGKYVADVNIAGITENYPTLYNAGILDPIKPALILPEVLDESRWWQGKHRYADPKREYVFLFLGIPQSGALSYNSNLVNPMEFKSYWDLVNPKWKGKIEARDMKAPGAGRGALRFFYHNPGLGPEFIRRLFATMDVTLFRDFRQSLDWLARGKFAICFGCRGADRAKLQGLPVDSFGNVWKEGAALVAHYGTITLVNRAPHPNTAKVFVNWFLSREGQITFQRALAKSEDNAPDSLRVDIPKDDIKPDSRRREGANYLEMDTPERMDMGPALKVFDEALAAAGRR
jgi:iron(III) transport system substrate-binding protein